MKIYRDKHDKSLYIEFTPDCFFHFVNDWKQLDKKMKWNWYNFRFINIEFELEPMTGSFEFLVVLLGFGIWFRWNYDKTKLEDLLKEVKNEKL